MLVLFLRYELLVHRVLYVSSCSAAHSTIDESKQAAVNSPRIWQCFNYAAVKGHVDVWGILLQSRWEYWADRVTSRS